MSDGLSETQFAEDGSNIRTWADLDEFLVDDLGDAFVVELNRARVVRS